ncbi:putative 28S rRNA (cytosine-C(5))-methyltransferase, partial [Coelomomyces lativittatus]
MTSTSEVIYFTASQIIQQVLKRKGSIKSLCLSSKSENKKKLYALVSQSLKYQSILQSILSHSKLLEKERKLTKALAWVLLYDFLLSPRRSIQCGGRLKFTIKKYTSVLIKSLDNVMQIHQVSSVDQLLHSCPSFTLSFPRYVRVNTLKISLDEVVSLFKLEGWTFLGILQTVETNLLKTNTFAADPLLSTYVLVFPTGTDFH